MNPFLLKNAKCSVVCLRCLFGWFAILVLITNRFTVLVAVTITVTGAIRTASILILTVMILVTGRFAVLFAFIRAGAILPVVFFILAIFMLIADRFAVLFTIVGAGAKLARRNVCLRCGLIGAELERHDTFFDVLPYLVQVTVHKFECFLGRFGQLALGLEHGFFLNLEFGLNLVNGAQYPLGRNLGCKLYLLLDGRFGRGDAAFNQAKHQS